MFSPKLEPPSMADKKPQEILSSSSSSIDVVMVPFPLQSHLNQLLQLSHIIASGDIRVHFVASSLHNSQVKSRTTSRNPNPNITFHDFPTPYFPSPAPSSTKFPTHLIPAYKASVALREPVKPLLESLSGTTRRLVVILDPLMSVVVQDARAFPNVEFYVFNCISAISSFVWARDDDGLKLREDIAAAEDCIDASLVEFVAGQFECLKTLKISGHLRNTCRVIESEFLDFLETRERKGDDDIKHWAIGPLETVTEFKNKAKNTSHRSDRLGQCFEWLNKQEPRSMLYVCFGTTTFMEDEQIRELAIGLELSGVKFVWVLRDADKANIFDEVEVRRPQLPLGFEERVEGLGTGMVVREWAPQTEILGHPSTGGFMSHCGWNSCLESMSLGVPLAAWPMNSDQPMNTALVVDTLKAGLVVREWVKRDEVVSGSAVAEAVKRLMKSEGGDEIKKTAENLGSELRKSAQIGGVSRLELESFIAHVTRV